MNESGNAPRRTYVWARKAWGDDFPHEGDPENLVDVVWFTVEVPPDSHNGWGLPDVKVSWYAHANNPAPVPRLEADYRAFAALGLAGDALKRTAEMGNTPIQPPAFCKLLEQCGFVDVSDEDW